MNIAETVRKNCTIPNALTLLRIMLIIPMAKYILAERYGEASVFLGISALSDMLDGLTLIAIVLCINRVYPYIYPFVAVMFAKEMIMLAGGAILLKKKIRPPAAKWFGKVATAVFYVSVILLVALRAVWGINISWLSTSLFGLSAGFMMFALMNYMAIFMKLMKENGNKGENQKFL